MDWSEQSFRPMTRKRRAQVEMISITTRKPVRSICSPDFVRRRATRCLTLVGFAEAQLSILLTSDIEIRELNRSYRQLDKPTDVLSFPQFVATPVREIPRSGLLGDVIISLDTALRQARGGPLPRIAAALNWGRPLDGWSVRDEVSFLLLHGVLHLLGFDHLNDKDALVMEGLEAQLCPMLLSRKRIGEPIDFD